MTSVRPANLPSLTGIRGVAALWVLIFHFHYLAKDHPFRIDFLDNWLAMAGWSAVDLFFLLSGFMLMHTHAQQFITINIGDIRNFAIARFLRVYPLSFAALLFVLLLVILFPSFAAFYRGIHAGNLSLTAFVVTACLATRWIPHIGDWNEPVWSLSAEIVGYALFPFLALSANRIRSFSAALLIAISAIALVIGYQAATKTLGDDNIGMRAGLLRMAGYFTAGIYLRRAAGIRVFSAALMSALSVIAVALLLALIPFHLGTGLLPLAFAILIFSLYASSGPVAWLLSSRPAMFFGRISFPLYLIHVMPLQAFAYFSTLHNMSSSQYGLIGLILIILLIFISWLGHIFIEKPCHVLVTANFRPKSAQMSKVAIL